ncbi:hypothetical protein WMY93_030903 [Mugilogobius chulae]|uniref:L27 domain-containing protein n=1 Tax=Mugilogobius chulae TaxID=88201 RepID=A0AAW0MQL6_9GOBI
MFTPNTQKTDALVTEALNAAFLSVFDVGAGYACVRACVVCVMCVVWWRSLSLSLSLFPQPDEDTNICKYTTNERSTPVNMPVRQKDAQRALELLQQYRLRLDQRQQAPGAAAADEDQQLNSSLDRVISVFQSQLFNALLDIQEYYELTIISDSQSSGVPSVLPSPHPPASPSAPLSPTASGESTKPKISPKPKSFKSPAPPIPAATKTTAATPPPQLQPQLSKKYRAPLPPASSKSGSDQTDDKGVKQAPQNGVKEFDLSDPASEYSTISPHPPVSPGERVSVSALVSSTIQGLLPTSPVNKGTGRENMVKTMSPGANSKEAASQKSPVSAQSSTVSSNARFNFSNSPTISPGPFAKGPLLSPKSPGSAKLSPTSPPPVSPKPAQPPKTPVKVDSPDGLFHEEVWPGPDGEPMNEVPALSFSSLYPQSHAYFQDRQRLYFTAVMNYIFGNNTLYPRSGRVGGSSGGQGTGPGVKQKLGPKRGSSEELGPPPHTSSPSTSSPASSIPSTSSASRWQQLLMFFSRRSAFTDCINASQVNASPKPSAY